VIANFIPAGRGKSQPLAIQANELFLRRFCHSRKTGGAVPVQPLHGMGFRMCNDNLSPKIKKTGAVLFLRSAPVSVFKGHADARPFEAGSVLLFAPGTLGRFGRGVCGDDRLGWCRLCCCRHGGGLGFGLCCAIAIGIRGHCWWGHGFAHIFLIGVYSYGLITNSIDRQGACHRASGVVNRLEFNEMRRRNGNRAPIQSSLLRNCCTCRQRRGATPKTLAVPINMD
jgi:hypothetical protein